MFQRLLYTKQTLKMGPDTALITCGYGDSVQNKPQNVFLPPPCAGSVRAEAYYTLVCTMARQNKISEDCLLLADLQFGQDKMKLGWKLESFVLFNDTLSQKEHSVSYIHIFLFNACKLPDQTSGHKENGQ